VSHILLIGNGGAISRRRANLPAGRVIEAWPDLLMPGGFWMDEESKALLDADGDAVAAELAIEAESIAVYYGPRLTDLDSLPTEGSLRTRVLSAHGIAVAWITLDRFGQRASYEPQSPTDPVFHLRRRGGGTGHLWRLFRTRQEAVVFTTEAYGEDSEAAEWARALTIADFAELVRGRGAAT
jgi:hypothetical protein